MPKNIEEIDLTDIGHNKQAEPEFGYSGGGVFQRIHSVVSPFDGEVYYANIETLDDIVDCYQKIVAEMDRLAVAEREMRLLLMSLSDGKARTERLQGKRHKVILNNPPDAWDQKRLKELWNEIPIYAQQYMRISQLAVQLREWKKVATTKGDKLFEKFKKIMKTANLGPRGLARIQIEK